MQGVESESARGQESDYLFGLGGRSAGVAGLRAIDRGEEEAADYAAQVDDARFVDLPRTEARVWSDDFSNLVTALKFR